MQTPSIGRIVHYVAYGTPGGEYKTGAHRAAVITQVHSPTCVDLCILNPTGLFFATSTPFYEPASQQAVANYSEGQDMPGTWHWPEQAA